MRPVTVRRQHRAFIRDHQGIVGYNDNNDDDKTISIITTIIVMIVPVIVISLLGHANTTQTAVLLHMKCQKRCNYYGFQNDALECESLANQTSPFLN